MYLGVGISGGGLTRPTRTSLGFGWYAVPKRSAERSLKARTSSMLSEDRNPSARSEAVVGIDLGTTNSVVAVVEGGAPAVVPDAEGGNTVPSVVAFCPNGEVLVGEKARRYAVLGPKHTFHSVKRFIGRTIDAPTVREDQARVAYDVVGAEDDAAALRCDTVDGGLLYPEEVSGMVVSRLLDNVRASRGADVSKAVISVPAYFDEEQKAATMAAGRIAGLETVRLIREPIAAALAYGLDLKEDRTVMVFDLGGGTFDVSILEVGAGVVEVLATGGDSHLGGDDWDAAIADWIASEHLKPAGVDTNDPRIKANLRSIAEDAKVQLSSLQKVVIRMPVGGGMQVVLTRGHMEKLTAHLFRRCQQPMEYACWQAGLDLGDARDEAERLKEIRKAKSKRQASKLKNRRMPVSEVLLVGGATRMPGIKRFIENVTGIKPRDTVDPDEAVAAGAAVQAGILDGQITGLYIMDVWQASLMRAFANKQQGGGPSDTAETNPADSAASKEDDEDMNTSIETIRQRAAEQRDNFKSN